MVFSNFLAIFAPFSTNKCNFYNKQINYLNMKKNLFTGMAAILFCGLFTSCSHEVNFDASAIEQNYQLKYEEAFKSRFGNPSPDQTWGFGASAQARTRATNSAPAPTNPQPTFNAQLAQMSDDKGTQTAAIIAEAIANVVAGYASASAQAGGQLGPWGWAAFSLAGLAQLAAMISQIHSLSGHAEGGILTGGPAHGDFMLARVNGGEMILNPRQQSNLFDMIDSGDFGYNNAAMQVDWRIRGTDLYGTLKNVSKTYSKTGKNIGII